MFINFSDIPGHQNLFLDYMYEFDNVRQFYKSDFRASDEYAKKFQKVAESAASRNVQLHSIVTDQYKDLKTSDKTAENISSLKEKNTLAVVTGQQLGMFGGPMYTLYKIITAVKLSKSLSEKYTGFNFVPIFWLEGDDHDFDEVSFISIINENNELSKVTYNPPPAEEESRGSVGFIHLNSSIQDVFTELDSLLRNTDFKPSIFENLRNFYAEGKSFKSSFKQLLFWLFDNYGLIIFDPQDQQVKELLKPVFKKEILNFRSHTEKLVHVSAKLEELYHAQVKVRPVNLFYTYENGRYLIDPVENEYRLKGKRKKFTKEELISLIDSEPQNFSPNVLLRPVCQDYVLPTAFYIGGPSEIAYFAQVTPLYDFYNIEPPIVYPRASATLVEHNIENIVDKYNLSLTELFMDIEQLKSKVVSSLSDTAVDTLFEQISNRVELAMDDLREKLFEIDKTVSDASSKYQQKISHYLNELKGKALEAQKRKYQTTLRQIDRASVNLYPNNNLQERELNFIYFANKYGMDIIEKIFRELETDKYEHQIIKL